MAQPSNSLRQLFVALLVGLPTWAFAAEAVRIDTSQGVPQIQVDGTPVRPRIFFGMPGSRPLLVAPEGGRIGFEFSPTQDELQQGTMHFRFGQVEGAIVLDDIHVTDLTQPDEKVLDCDFEESGQFEQQWHIWPPPDQNNVGSVALAPGAGANASQALRIELKSPANGRWPDFHIYHHPNLKLRKGHRYQVSLWARATPERALTIAFYRPGDVFTFLGGPPSCFESQIKLAADADVHFVSFPVHMPWPRPGQPVDWSATDQQCRTVLEANPRALLIPRIGMGAPAWWRAAHPESVMAWDRGPQQHTDVVVASPVYLHDAGVRLEELVRHLEAAFGPHMAGYHPCGQNTGEWFYQETWGAALNGYSEASQIAWRRWLQARYRDDNALRDAWCDSSATLQDAVVPSPESRRAAPTGVLHDPLQARSLIDFAEFQQEMMANCVCHFANAVRRASAGQRLVVFFYGYVHEFGAIRNGAATSGHYALRRVLDCPDIDVLCSPISYFDRALGESGPAMTAAESVALAGKMWLVEDDTRTWLGTGTFPGWQDGANTIEETNQLLLRNTAQCAVRNFATWWMDLGATGWFDDPRMWQQMKRLRTLDESVLRNPLPYQPEIAVIVDEHAMLYVAAGGDAVTRPSVYEVRRALGRCGAPYGQYLLDDVLAGKVHARLYVFANCWCLTPTQRRDLVQATQGAAKIWCYAPGYLGPDGTSLEAVRQLTGFSCTLTKQGKSLAQPTATGRRLGITQPLGVDRPVSPLLAVTDAQDQESIACFATGECAVAMRRLETGVSILASPPGLSSELVRLAAREAGVKRYTNSDFNVYANGPFLVLHASEDGTLEVDTGHPGRVYDLLEGKQVGLGPRITLQVRRGDTHVWQMSPDPQ